MNKKLKSKNKKLLNNKEKMTQRTLLPTMQHKMKLIIKKQKQNQKQPERNK